MGCRAPKVITNLLSILLHTMKRSNSHRQATRVTFPCITQFEGHGITTYRHQSLHRQLMPHRQLDFCEAPRFRGFMGGCLLKATCEIT
jgi:hypothetical protein